MSRIALVLVFLGLVITAAAAKPTPAVAPASIDAGVAAGADDADDADDVDLPPHRMGPALVDLGEGVEIDLPADFVLYERDVARAMLEAGGENSDGVLGIVTQLDAEWVVFVGLEGVGYVSDADANQLDPDELFASMQRGNAAQNRVRLAKGSTEFFLDGWSQPPSYDATARVLSWGTRGHSVDGETLNVFTNVLGRRGFLSIDLNTAPERLAAATAAAAPAMRGLRFQAGHRYQDFDPAVDRNSGLSLRNLIVGGTVVAAGSKLGLFAKILLVLKKALIAIAAAIAGLYKLIKSKLARRRAAPAASEDATS